jgi:hypothetical protein
MSDHTPTPWAEIEYDNDTGPSDEGFWEWWEIPGIARFDKEADAQFARTACNSHEALMTALEEMLTAFSMENIGIDASRRRLAAKKQARAALDLARSKP